MRARLALLISGSVVELREITLRNKPSQMLEASAKGTVPVLALPDGRVIDESLDIMRWALGDADSGHDPEGWMSGDDAALIARNDGPFKNHLDRYKYPDLHGSDPLAHRAAGLEILRDLELRLDRTAQLCGATRTLADMAIFPFIRQFAATDQPWFDALPLPRVQHWLSGHLASALFERAMLRLPAWQEADEAVMFG